MPNYAYYGVQTMRAVENFPITGYKIHEGLIKAFAIVKKAAALANADVGRLELKRVVRSQKHHKKSLMGNGMIISSLIQFKAVQELQ